MLFSLLLLFCTTHKLLNWFGGEGNEEKKIYAKIFNLDKYLKRWFYLFGRHIFFGWKDEFRARQAAF